MKLDFKGKQKWWSYLVVALAVWVLSDILVSFILNTPLEPVDLLATFIAALSLVGVYFKKRWSYYLTGIMGLFSLFVGGGASLFLVMLAGLDIIMTQGGLVFVVVILLGLLLTLLTLILLYKSKKTFGIKGILK